MTTLILGAGGILGQHMQVSQFELALGKPAVYVRRTPSRGYAAVDLSRFNEVQEMLEKYEPSVIVNMAGENNVNSVQGYPPLFAPLNVGLPYRLAKWCNANDAHLIQVSTQGVFSGDHAPYDRLDTPHANTEYGAQKAEAERLVEGYCDSWTIARVTFVLGVRPFPELGRVNPLEQMFQLEAQRQVNDRWFSVAFAKDVAAELWKLVETKTFGKLHLGTPERTCRYDIAKLANPAAEIEAVSDAEFEGPCRPLDTTWAEGSIYKMSLVEGIEDAREDWESTCTSNRLTY